MGAVPWSYPLIMLASVTVAALLSRRGQRSLGLSRRERLGIALGAFCGAMIGAKLPFALADWEGLVSGRAWLDNGKTIVFGFVGGYFGVELMKARLGIRVKTGDSFAVPVALAISIGRLGCFVAGCCYGTVTTLPW
jgi:phosphatidylglycerol:prolipoprotein diacylglycerol transferase